MKKLIILTLLTSVSIAGAAPDESVQKAEEPYTGSDASIWIPKYGEEWFKHYADNYVALYPGGRSNVYHDAYIGEAWYSNPTTKDWDIFQRDYIYDGQWFGVLWFYRATKVDNGFKQVESTIGMGKIVDGKLKIWIEYFDDSVGHMQELRIMPKFKEGDEGLPWPEGAPITQEYRP